MAFVSTMILRSMRMTGEKPRGATLNATEAVEALDEFNTFLESMSIDRLMCYSVTQDSLLLTASTTAYTIGPGATINTDRPIKLVDPCWIRDGDNYDYNLKVINLQQYGTLTDKSSGATIPTAIYYDAGLSATSTATLTLYPPPTAGLTLYIHSWKQFSTASTVSQNVNLPPAYKLFVESNFAIHLAAGFRSVSNEVAKIAKDTKAMIRAQNAPSMVATLDHGTMVGSSLEHSIYIDSEYIE